MQRVGPFHRALLGALLASGASAQVDAIRVRDLVDTDTRFELAAPTTRGAWEDRAAEVRDRLAWAAGLVPPPPRRSLHPILGPITRGRGFEVRAFAFESAPELWVRGTLYAPADAPGPWPVVLTPHGHWGHGRFQQDDLCSVRARCIALARRGALVLAWDMLGFGESAEQLRHHESLLEGRVAELWGLGPFQLQTWNSLRVLDFALSLPGADPARVGVTGASGGGTQTFVLAALDPRVTVSAPVNMVSARMQGGCSCENAAGLRLGVTNPEIAATFAPRPQLLVSASGDWTQETPTHEFPYLRAVYALCGAPDRVANAHFDKPHNYDADSRAAVIAFFDAHLFGRGTGGAIDEADPPADSALRLPPELLPARAKLPLETRVAAWRHEVLSALAPFAPHDLRSLAALRELVGESLSLAVGARFTTRVVAREALATEQGPVQAFEREGRTVRWAWLGENRFEEAPAQPPRRLVVLVAPDGLAGAAELRRRAEPLRRDGWTPVVVEPWGTGAARPDPETSQRGKARYLTTFHRSDPAEAVYDLLSFFGGLSRLLPSAPGEGEVLWIALGSTGPQSLAAACLVPAHRVRELGLELRLDLDGNDGSDEALLRSLALPNLARCGGLPALLATVSAPRTRCTAVGEMELGWARVAAALERRSLVLVRGARDPFRN